jgi:hypothetical protein
MNITVSLVISFSPEVLALLKLGMNPESAKQGTLDVPQAPAKTKKEKTPAPVETPEETDDDVLGDDDVDDAITREKVREVASVKTNAGKKDAVIAILKKYKASNIKTLDEKHFEAVYKALEKL